MTKIKICGLMTTHDIEIVNHIEPDLVGFVFAKGRHQINNTQATQLRQLLKPQIQAVGVFIDTPLNEIIRLYATGTIQIAQLHGNQTEADVQTLMNAGVPVIKVFKPASQKITETQADYVMLDSGNGSGTRLNWQNITVDVEQPLLLAGGLTPDNARTAIELLHPEYLDVSSGVEKNGHKDYELVKQIVTIAHKN